MRRRDFNGFVGGAAALLPFATRAQSAKIARIGFLGAASASGWASKVEAFRAGLRDLGYVEGKNIVIEYRWAEGRYERLPELAAELVRQKVDVPVAQAAPGDLHILRRHQADLVAQLRQLARPMVQRGTGRHGARASKNAIT